MTTYVVLLPGDEAAWEQAPAEQRAAVYERHTEFARVLAERGHTVTGGAELAHSRTARTLRAGRDGLVVTDGPYAEAVEQLTGFYLVESDDADDLLDVCRILAGSDSILGDAKGAIEVRAVVGGEEGDA
ncbi:MAG TPA: YciI family protein [Nocardioides sp.]|nr:YciI family protein [Nocardioides sp.]